MILLREVMLDKLRSYGVNEVAGRPIKELKHWHRETRGVQVEGGRRRTEVLWINPVAMNQMGQQTIFSLPGVQLG